MASLQEQVQVVDWIIEFKSATHVQRKWGTNLEVEGSSQVASTLDILLLNVSPERHFGETRVPNASIRSRFEAHES
ncbi:hypothetical protein TNCV_3753191 [Trichonephila clavipes]|nr:hypothetical protein TNCV_3753191 [Trichonephila clavipes]